MNLGLNVSFPIVHYTLHVNEDSRGDPLIRREDLVPGGLDFFLHGDLMANTTVDGF